MEDTKIAFWRWCALAALWLATDTFLAWTVTGGFSLSDRQQAFWAIALLASLNVGMAILFVNDLRRRARLHR